MGNIVKYSIERLEHRNLEVKVDCPNCGAARVTLAGNGSQFEDTRCPKCGIHIILDALNITGVHERSLSQSDAPFERATSA